MAASRVSSVFIWLLLGCFLSFRRHVSGKSKHVSITLDAKWENTPILLEASEFLAKEKNEYFWGFVEDVAKMKPDRLHTESNQSLYSMILQLTAKHMSSLQLNLLKLSLSLRTASPVIAMHNQIAKEDSLAQECETFVNIHGQGTCDPEKLKELIEQVKSRPPSPIFKFDHHFPGSGNSGVTVILYAEIGRASFQKFHFLLSQMAIKREVNYILRHYVQKPSEKKVRLSGYGVELAIKSTEYKAKDDTKVEDEKYRDGEDEEAGEDEVQGFIFSKLRQLYPDMKEQLKEFQNHLIDTTKELAPLKVWQLQDLSLQAAQWVVSASSDALQVLKEICQNFPTQARSLVRTPVKDELRKEIEKNQKFFENQHNIYPGDSILLINGLPVDMEVYDIFSLLDIMWSEAAVMDGLHSMGVREQSVKLLKIDLKGGGDDYALDFRHSAVEYINNLESDSKYRHWPSSIQEMLRPTFPGMLRHIGKNIFHMVFILNPADPHSTELLKIAEAFYVHSAPVRIGLVFSVNSSQEVNGHMDAGVAFTRAFNFIKIDKSPSAGLSFVTDVYEKTKKKEMTAEFVVKEFASRFPDEDVDKVFGDDDDYDDVRKAARDFLTKSGLSDLPQILLNGVPLKKEYLTPDTLEEGVVTAILESTSDIQKAVYKGEIDDGTTILNWLMEKEHVLPRMNSRILSPPAMLLDLTENVDKDIFEDPETFGQLTSKDMSSVLVQNVHYISRKDDESRCVVTIWIVTDLETSEGRELVYSAIKSLKYSSNMRIGIIFNSDSHEADVISVNKAVYVALKTLHGHMLKSLVTKLVKEENVAALKSGEKTLQDLEVYGMDMAAYLKSMKAQDDKYLISYRSFVEKVINMEKSALAVIANGKVIGPLSESKLFIQEDFNLLEKHTMQSVAKKVATHIEAMGLEGKEASDLILRVSALLSSKPSSESRKDIKFHSDQHSVVKIQGGDPSSPVFEVEAILDPVSMEAQKLVPILLVLSEVTNVDIKIFMNSKDKLSEMPLKNFYRYVLEPEISFRNDETFSSGPAAKFTDLPQKSLLTVNMYPPESWLVEAVRSPHDLDNILLEEKESGVLGEFELENILLEGHCHDSITGQPPRGLQFTLGTNSTTVTVDTIVMANLGYFQLKANPGAWLLRLRDGRSLDIYEITSHEFTDTPLGSKDAVVTIDSFKSKTIRVKVSKKVEKMNEELLKEDDENKGIWDSISSSFRSTDDKEDKDTTLNIFSLASGHLYERFLRIMMLSVIKNTKSKVKFWFLKNYLSPTVKDFIPHMAKEYGFEYELVQYKWPRWLNQQKEKQRIIWGYKILFLDVLFPLHVKKIIFVDADQIVRTDMQELYDLDLGSAPYGYTPFCDSRKEMDGFRFWKSGYWASHLAGRKYHISALYVVDLKRFRRIAAGDRLRGQYQGLSQDPNSLSNLDQDLPNNMIHQVNIKSLPQEWLWCETWCSTEELKNAKTIDLCNNPMTKEPKLQAAMRILPEWKDYDYEIKVLWDKIYNTSTRLQTEYEKPVADTSEKDRSRDEL